MAKIVWRWYLITAYVFITAGSLGILYNKIEANMHSMESRYYVGCIDMAVLEANKRSYIGDWITTSTSSFVTFSVTQRKAGGMIGNKSHS